MRVSLFKILKSYGIISVGVFLYCFGWVAFLIPKGIAGGGVTGMSSIIYFATGLGVSYSYVGINAVLLLMGTIVLGNKFGFKTIYSILLATLLFNVLPRFGCITNFSDIDEKLINAIIGGSLSAFGIVAIFFQGGSTGGTDILALIVAKYKNLSIGKFYMYSDIIIIGSILFLPGKGLQDVVYGYIELVSFSFMVDLLLTGSKQSVQIIIISPKYKDIADMLVHDMDRGVTALKSVGWYSQKESNVLLVIARKFQLSHLTAAIKAVDDNAFISVSSVMGVYGEGFEKIKEKPAIVSGKKIKKTTLQRIIEGGDDNKSEILN